MLQQNNLHKNVVNTLHGLGSMMQGSLYLLMKALWIAGQHSEVMPGHFGAQKHNARHFLYMDDGNTFLVLLIPSSMLTCSSLVLPALSLHNGILHCDIIEGSFCTETFLKFIDSLLDNMQPFPAPNSVIVMDNCQIHKHSEIRERIAER
jgi:hypothetical protein